MATKQKEEGPGSVRFGSVTVWGRNGSSGSGFRFRRFLCKKGLSVCQYSFTGKGGSGFGSWKTVPAVPVQLSVSGKTVPTVPVSGSGSVPGPSCKKRKGPPFSNRLRQICGDLAPSSFEARS